MSIKAVTAGYAGDKIWYMTPEGSVEYAQAGKELPYPYFYNDTKPTGYGIVDARLENVRILRQDDILETRLWKVEVTSPSLIPKFRSKKGMMAEDDIAWLERRLGADGDIFWEAPKRISYMDVESDRKTGKFEINGSVLEGKYEVFRNLDDYFQAMEGSKVAAATAWNGDAYDFKILGSEGNPYWGHMAHIDSMELYSKFTTRKTKRALAVIARYEKVGEKMNPETTDPLVYNENDCRIMEAIIKKRDLVGTQYEVANLTGIFPHPDALRAIALFENYLMKNRPKFNLWLEGGHSYRPNKDTFEGALVIYGEPGMYDGIVMGDFTSLYPNVVINGKYEGEGQEVWRVNQLLAREWTSLKEKSKGSKREAYKVLANGSGYGIFASSAFRYSNKPIAAFIAAQGREKLMEMRKIVEEMGFKPLLSDTDSCAVQVPKEKADKLIAVVNRRLAPFVVKKEYYGTRLLEFGDKKGNVVKKRYAVLTESGELVVKGLEPVRNDRSPWSRDTTEKLLKVLLTCPLDDAKRVFKIAVEAEKAFLMSGRVPVEDVAITKSLDPEKEYKVKPQHVRAFENSTEKQEGVVGFVTYWVTKKGTFTRDGLTDEEIAKKVDWSYVWKHQMEPIVERLQTCYAKPTPKLELWVTPLDEEA